MSEHYWLMCLAQLHLLLRWSMVEVTLTTHTPRPVPQGASSCQSRSEAPPTIWQTTSSGRPPGWARSSEGSTGKPRQNTQTRGTYTPAIALQYISIRNTGRFRRLGQCFLDWATAVVDQGDTFQLSVSFTTPQQCGPIYETLAQSTEFDGTSLSEGAEKR